MNKKQRQFIAGELVKLAKELTASKEIVIYKKTVPITFIGDEKNDLTLDEILYDYEASVENFIGKDYNVYANWKGRPKVEESGYLSTDYTVKGNIEFTFTLNRISDTDLDRFIERGIKQG